MMSCNKYSLKQSIGARRTTQMSPVQLNMYDLFSNDMRRKRQSSSIDEFDCCLKEERVHVEKLLPINLFMTIKARCMALTDAKRETINY
jgi:hypothetical protein